MSDESPTDDTNPRKNADSLTAAERDERKRAARTRKIAAAEHKLKVFALRRAGSSFQEIADALQISKTRAHQIVDESLQQLNEQLSSSVEQHRALDLARCDKLLVRLDTMTRTSFKAVLAYVRVLERRAKLLGLDSATKFSIETPVPERELPNDALDREIEKLQQQVNAEDAKTKLRLVNKPSIKKAG